MALRLFEDYARVARRGLAGLAAAGLLSVAVGGGAAAQDETVANAGNGGVASASANGGSVLVGDIDTGGNSGNVISVDDTVVGGYYGWYFHPVYGWVYGFIVGDASVVIDGGEVSNSTTISVSADGGAATANAAGGDDNVAVAIDRDA